MGAGSGQDEVTKMATCEITNTSGVYPIYGTITLTQTVRIIGPILTFILFIIFLFN